MDFYSLGFLFAIILVSGVIAYVADNLGKKLGKQRRSLWGMRPRHTAAVFTVAMGMTLSVLTIFLVMASSSSVRRWIIEGSKAQAELNLQKDEIRQLDAQLADKQRASDAADRAHEKRETEAKQLIAGNQKTLADQNSQITQEKAKIATLGSAQKKLEGDLVVTKQNLSKKETELKKEQVDLNKKSTALAYEKKNLSQVQAALNVVLAAKEKQYFVSRDLDAKNKVLLDSIDDNTKKIKLLGSQVDQLTKDYQSKSTAFQDLQAVYANEQEKLAALRDEASQYANQRDSLVDLTMTSRINRMTYHRLQEVTRLPVDGNLTEDQAKDALAELLVLSQTEAKRRGAKRRGKYEAADFNDRTEIDADVLKKKVVTLITSQTEPSVLIASSSFNAFEDEPVSIDVSLLKNPVVYHQRQVVAESEINGGGTDLEISRELSAFGQQLHDRAKKDKMIPLADDESYGALSLDQAVSLVNSVKQAGHVVKLQAVVLSDTRAADPLKLDFRIR